MDLRPMVKELVTRVEGPRRNLPRQGIEKMHLSSA
jgi:hypothetical protein